MHPKPCLKCKYFKRIRDSMSVELGDLLKCTHPKLKEESDPVFGVRPITYKLEELRQNPNYCGWHGKYWESNDEDH